MTLFIDPPAWTAHGRLWSHLVSDTSYDELHVFAATHGIPRRGFERDHYDVPDSAYDALVAAGAVPVSTRELLDRLVGSGLRRRKAVAMARRAPGNALLRPRRLRRGNRVAVCAPGGPIAPERLAAGVQRLQGWGLHVEVMPHTLGRGPFEYLSGTDAERAADFSAAWMDDRNAAVIAGRGGYGVQRMLDLLDWRRLAEVRPKILAGFSDITALHLSVAARLGLVTLHSPVVTSLGAAESVSAETMRAMLFEPRILDLLADQAVQVLVPGTASGVLLGGNLSLVAAEIGTPHARPASGGIVLLEDVDEAPYRIDRLLTQLLRSGWLDGVRGVVLGAFTDCGDLEVVHRVVLDRLGGLGVPIVAGLDVGHTTTSRCVPLGVPATLRTASGSAALELGRPPFS